MPKKSKINCPKCKNSIHWERISVEIDRNKDFFMVKVFCSHCWYSGVALSGRAIEEIKETALDRM